MGPNTATHQNPLALVKRDTVDIVAQKVREFQQSGELHLPANYSAENAMKSAWLTLQTTTDKDKRLALQVCTRDSIANSLLDMVVQGLNPAKKQCYFLVYGNQLVCQRSYFGDMALVQQRVLPGSEIWYGVIYQGDQFEYAIERGRRVITKHIQALGNVAPDKIQAAYCVIEPGSGRPAHTEIMTIDQIKRSWQQSQTYKDNGNGVHQKFTDQMCLRTVIRRACKAVINASSDDYLLLERVNRSDEQMAEAEVEAEAAAHANGEVIDTEPVAVQSDPEPTPEPEPLPAAPAPPAQRPQAQQTRIDGPGF